MYYQSIDIFYLVGIFLPNFRDSSFLETTTMSDSTPNPERDATPTRIPPHPLICRTRPIVGMTSCADCLAERPVECQHALSCGDGHLCLHTNWKDFVPSQTCRVKPIPNTTDAGHCLMKRERECEYALAFGKGYLCRHPDWRDYAGKTVCKVRAIASDTERAECLVNPAVNCAYAMPAGEACQCVHPQWKDFLKGGRQKGRRKD